MNNHILKFSAERVNIRMFSLTASEQCDPMSHKIELEKRPGAKICKNMYLSSIKKTLTNAAVS